MAETCNHQPTNRAYAPCSRTKGHDGPCAHEFADDAPYVRSRPYKSDRKRVENAEWSRASGDSICGVCNEKYYDHPPVMGYPWLRQLCGQLVKL